MDRGMDFLKSQINNAVMQHASLVQAVEDHESQAEDPRFRDLCSRFIPQMREHQRMLEDYQLKLGAEHFLPDACLGAKLELVVLQHSLVFAHLRDETAAQIAKPRIFRL